MPGKSRKAGTATRADQNKLRIIGGKWRGRKISFPELEKIRPTPDRIRETLFNWLQAEIAGARCLDLFAGSGALGFEAASRGAAEVVLLDSDRNIINTIQSQISLLGADNIQVMQTDALAFLQSPPPGINRSFDIIFLDPPFGKDLLPVCIEQLEKFNWLADDATIYIESESSVQVQYLPDNWKIHHSKRAGQVMYHLIYRSTPSV